MLHLRQSHRLEALLAALAAEVQVPLSSPFATELVVVQSKGMGRWIALRLAEYHGICANIQFPLPAAFLWQLLRACFDNLPDRSAFAPEVLAWRIMAWLEIPAHLQAAPRLAACLRSGDARQRLQLASRIAALFDQYLVYRPDWIAAWEQGRLLGLAEDEAWQALLWRDLIADQADSHRAEVVQQLVQRLTENTPAVLPERVSVFGVSSLPPVFLDVLQALSERVDVYLYALNPCREYWGEIRDQREIERIASDATAEDLYLEVGHPLLASLGKQGRDFFDRLAEFPQLDELFLADPDATPRGSLLEVLQADILELVDRRQTAPWSLAAADDSLQVHVCHGPMREVEVLHDRLLDLLQRYPELQPADIVVFTPDIALYAPYLEAVFTRRQGQPYIPYRITDRSLSAEQPLLAVFLALLDLPDSRYPVDWLLSLLEQPAMQRRFGFAENDLDLIRHWLQQTGVCWGRDAQHKRALDLPPNARHTWREGLNRLLLGYALPQALAGDASPLYQGILPYDDVEGSRAATLGRLAAFAETLFALAERMTRAGSLSQWRDTLNELISRLFDPDDAEQAALQQIRDALELLTQLSDQAAYSHPVDLAVVKHWLANELQKTGDQTGFFSGGVTFGTLVPMRNLPFRVVCLLGMDEGAFPRRQRQSGFDLMTRHPRRGDRSRRADDRYLFLEALMSARQVFYLSYRGRDARDNGERPASVLIEELLDTVRCCFVGANASDPVAQIVHVHPLQPFSPRYFQQGAPLASYSSTWLQAARCLGRGALPSGELFAAELPEPESEWLNVTPEALFWFYTNPARYLLENRLNLRLERMDVQLPTREPFALDYFTAQALREDALRLCCRNHALSGVEASGGFDSAQPTDNLQAQGLALADAKGWLPHGAFGAALYARESNLALRQAAHLLPLLPSSYLEPLPLQFQAGAITLSGWLKGVSAQGLLDWTPDKLTPRHRLKLWLRHLLLCYLRPTGVSLTSRLLALNDGLVFGPVADAEAQLSRLLAHYYQGLRRPLPFFVKTSYVYAEKCQGGAGQQKADHLAALQAANHIWYGSEFSPAIPESANPYYQTVYRDSNPLDDGFAALALDIFAPMFGLDRQ